MTKYLVVSPVPDKSAETVARAIFNDFILVYAPMREIRTDCGTEYKNKLIAELCRLMKINQSFSTSYRHESVGSIERNHEFFNQYIRSFVENVRDWEPYLKFFTFCYNTSSHSSLDNKYSPFELVFGNKPNMPYNLTNRVDPVYNLENYVNEIK